jgi:hypothetical protein
LIFQNFIDASGDIVKDVVVKKTMMELAAPAMTDDVSLFQRD